MDTFSSPIARRINGVPFETGANRPFLLDDPGRIFHVERGHLDIFAVETRGGEALGRQPFVTRVPEGMMAFSGVRQERNGDGDREALDSFSLFAVPSRDATIIVGEAAQLTADGKVGLDTTIWVDEWIVRLSEFLARASPPPPRDTHLLEAEPRVPYPAGATLSALHSDIIWVSADRKMRFLDREHLVIAPDGPALPVSEWTWLRLPEDTHVSAVYTPAMLTPELLWPALNLFNIMVQEFAALLWAENIEHTRERHRRSVAARRGATVHSIHRLSRVLDDAPAHEVTPPPSATGHTPLQAALRLVADAIGAPLEFPREIAASVPDHGNPVDVIPTLIRASGLRCREIALPPGWWERDGPSFVGFEGENGRPLAVLSDQRGAYRAIDPEGGAPPRTVDRRVAEELVPRGMMLYPPLPAEVDNGLAAIRHALTGRARDITTLIAMGVLAGVFALVTPILTGYLLAEALPRADLPMWAVVLGALLLAAFGALAFQIVNAFAMLRIESRMDERLQASVWSRLLSLPMGFFRNYTAGDLADRMGGITVIRQLLTGATVGAALGGLFSVFSFFLLFWYSWSLALCALGLVLVLIAVTWWFARAQMAHHRVAFTAQGKIDGLVFQMLSGLSKLRIANAETHALGRWAEHFAVQRRATLRAQGWAAGQAAINGVFSPLALLVLFAFIWYALIEGQQQSDFDLRAFLSFNAAFGQFAAGMIGLTAAWTTMVAAIPLFERVRPILEAAPETAGEGIDPGDLSGGIEFENVSFRYLPDAPNALDGVSFTIRPGDHIAFVGPSGSGKSTIYRLLLGFERPDSGAIFVDGHNLTNLDRPAVRSRMGVVMQNSQLIADSIFRNIASSTASLTLDEAWEAARAAGLAEDIEAMPMGMHTVLPETGGLSGGQKQRLLIARALARKPRILLFDEATSALDNRTQAIVQESLSRLSITRIVIAHRLSTIEHADRIYVLEQGRIVESGTYDELMRNEGVFAALARRQTTH